MLYRTSTSFVCLRTETATVYLALEAGFREVSYLDHKSGHIPTDTVSPCILGFRTISSVADPGCLSRIRIFSHPGSKNSNKREG
jgi:hypothetical protein